MALFEFFIKADAELMSRWYMSTLSLLIAFNVIAILHAPFNGGSWQSMSKTDKGLWFASMALLPILLLPLQSLILLAVFVMLISLLFNKTFHPIRWFLRMALGGWLVIMVVLFSEPRLFSRLQIAWQEWNGMMVIANDGWLLAIVLLALWVFVVKLNIWLSLQRSMAIFVSVVLLQNVLLSGPITVGVAVLITLGVTAAMLWWFKSKINT